MESLRELFRKSFRKIQANPSGNLWGLRIFSTILSEYSAWNRSGNPSEIPSHTMESFKYAFRESLVEVLKKYRKS